jgi:chorismate-pyruvate lyase
MKKFRFETEVEVTVVNEYFIDANSLEEALEMLQTGEVRGEGIILRENFNWETEIITVEEEI